MITFAYWFGWAVGATCATWICVSHYQNKARKEGGAKSPGWLRDTLRQAVDVICEDCDITDDFGNLKCKNCKWRNALAKASGESEVAE